GVRAGRQALPLQPGDPPDPPLRRDDWRTAPGPFHRRPARLPRVHRPRRPLRRHPPVPDRPRTSLGADLAAPGIVAAEEARAARVEEFRTVTADEADLASIFITFDPDYISGGEPGGVAELQFLGSLGLSFTNADTPPS